MQRKFGRDSVEMEYFQDQSRSPSCTLGNMIGQIRWLVSNRGAYSRNHDSISRDKTSTTGVTVNFSVTTKAP
jgi:hypothetical protein